MIYVNLVFTLAAAAYLGREWRWSMFRKHTDDKRFVDCLCALAVLTINGMAVVIAL